MELFCSPRIFGSISPRGVRGRVRARASRTQLPAERARPEDSIAILFPALPPVSPLVVNDMIGKSR
jgi:hypothetical protein